MPGEPCHLDWMGKVLGCFCAIFGVFIAFPTPIIGNSFAKFYNRQKLCDKSGGKGSEETKKIKPKLGPN